MICLSVRLRHVIRELKQRRFQSGAGSGLFFFFLHSLAAVLPKFLANCL